MRGISEASDTPHAIRSQRTPDQILCKEVFRPSADDHAGARDAVIFDVDNRFRQFWPTGVPSDDTPQGLGEA